MKRLSSLQTLRAFAANAVVIHHFVSIELKYGGGFRLLPEWVSFLGWTGVNCFFVISGCVMGLLAGQTRWNVFLQARVMRIYPIYWIFTTLVLLVFLIKPEIVNSSYSHPPSILKSYLLWPDDVPPVLGVGWSLISEMYFYLVLTVIIMFGFHFSKVLAVWAALIVVAPMLLDVPNQSSITEGDEYAPVIALFFSPLTLEFIAGAWIGAALKAGETRGGGLSLIIGVILLPIGACIYVLRHVEYQDVWSAVLLLGLPFPLIIYGVAALEMRRKWPRLGFIEKLGDASYSTYLSHVLTLAVVGRAFQWTHFHGWIAECIFAAACLVAVNTVGLLSYRFAERPLLILTRRWFSLQRPVQETAKSG